MLKAILVDDEQLSIHMMENLIEWERYGVRIVATAADGLEALEKFRENVPNIVITDIKMPNLDGIEFIRRVREISVDAEIIFISAYADFSFVKEAIALGCSNYLLKPVDEVELEKTLQKITQKISEKSISRNLALRNETQKKKKLLRDYLRTNTHPALGRKLFAEFCPEGSSFLLMSVTVRHETIDAYTGASSLAGDQIAYEQERIEQIAAERAPCLALEDEECTWLLVLRTGSQEDAVAIAQAVQRFLRGEGKAKVRICFSRCAARASEAPVLYAQVMQFEKYSQYLGDIDILGSDYRCNEEEFHKARYAEYGRQAAEALRRRDTADAQRILEEALRSSTAISPHDLSSIYEFCFEIVLCAKGLLPVEDAANEESAWLAEIRYGQISAIPSLEQLRAFMIRVIRALATPPQGRAEQYSQLVREGIDFLAAHYDQNLSLDEICKHLSISKTYFSFLFKRDTGVSLWAYLTGIRMRRAKALLRDTNLKSLEIAYQIGYDNPSYFSKLFKKLNGQTPNEYRASARKEDDA